MDANFGNNPSFVWRSLLAIRDLIWEGSDVEQTTQAFLEQQGRKKS